MWASSAVPEPSNERLLSDLDTLEKLPIRLVILKSFASSPMTFERLIYRAECEPGLLSTFCSMYVDVDHLRTEWFWCRRCYRVSLWSRATLLASDGGSTSLIRPFHNRSYLSWSKEWHCSLNYEFPSAFKSWRKKNSQVSKTEISLALLFALLQSCFYQNRPF